MENKPENKPQQGLGEYLRSERESKHITIEQVASATKINIKLLHSLESDSYDSLPAKPFVRGFVISYARYLGLDARDVLSRFDIFLDEKSGRKFKRPENAPHIFVEKEGQSDNSKTVLSVVMAGFLVMAVVVFAVLKPSLKHKRHRGKDKAPLTNEEVITVMPPPAPGTSPVSAAPIGSTESQSTTSVAEPKEKTEPAPISASTSHQEPEVESKPAPKPSPSVAAKPSPNPSPTIMVTSAGKLPPIPNNEVRQRLIVRAIEDAWVKYQVDDRPVQAYTLRKDKVIYVRARTSLRFTTAKPRAIEISFDNKEFQAFGSAAKTIILPKEMEKDFQAQPFIPPNPAYLSTPN